MFDGRRLVMPTLVFAVVASSLVACVVESGHSHQYYRNEVPSAAPDSAPSGTPAPAPSASASATPASTSPMLAVIDTNQVMTANPGEGVGIFTEYAAGGKWHIFWTCDTAISGQVCVVSLSVTTTDGELSNLDTSALPVGDGALTSPAPSRFDVSSLTTVQTHGVSFVTTPGATITLGATVGGLRDVPPAQQSFFFFVQDKKVNGGYTGRLTNPLQLRGSTP